MLAEFSSVVDAVRCAAEVQRAMADRNAETPEDKRITFRVGINLGDVIAEPDDIYGDGVNVAARLEALSEPGGICVSRVVRDFFRRDRWFEAGSLHQRVSVGDLLIFAAGGPLRASQAGSRVSSRLDCRDGPCSSGRETLRSSREARAP